VTISSRSPSPIFLSFMIVTLILPFVMGNSDRFQICPNSQVTRAELPKVTECNVTTVASRNESFIIYLPKLKPPIFTAYRCWSLVTELCTNIYGSIFWKNEPTSHTATERRIL
jgi:hypothetical protein